MEGNPSAGNIAPQAQTQTAQNTAQGDTATPLETGLRQRGEARSSGQPKPRRLARRRWPTSTRKGGRSVSEAPRSSTNA